MRPLLTALGLVAAWEALVWLTGVPPYILPPPSRVAVVLVGRFDLLIEQAAWTATEMILGLALGLTLGAALAGATAGDRLAGHSRDRRRAAPRPLAGLRHGIQGRDGGAGHLLSGGEQPL